MSWPNKRPSNKDRKMFLSPTEDLAADIKRPCRNMNAAEEMPVCSSMLGFICRKGFDVPGLCCTAFLEVRSQELCPAGTELPGIQTAFPASSYRGKLVREE